MRETYHAELDQLTEELVRLAELVELEMGRATAALLDADLVLAERVIDNESIITDRCQQVDEAAVIVLARQQPVATDLRLIVADLRITADLERMGRLARHLAELVRQRHPTAVVPAALRGAIDRMGQVAARITTKATSALARRDPVIAAEMERDDDEMDELQQDLYWRLLHGDWPDGTEVAMDVGLIGRYYERYADHAVSIAARIAYVVGRRPAEHR
jgi:phosphate transport system protein